MKPPNIVFLIADDHRFDALGAAGHAIVRTPHLDKLAKNGTRLSNLHIMGGFTGGVCAPCRAAIHSGANPFKAGGAKNINPQLNLLGETLQHQGYHTHAVGKWHNDIDSFQRSFCNGERLFFGGMGDPYHMPLHVFDQSGEYTPEQIFYEEGHATELFSEAAVRFLETYSDQKPYFLHVAFTSPHDPRTAPEQYHLQFPPDDIPLPPNFIPSHPFDNGEMDIRDEMLAAHPRQPAEIRRHIADYYAMISHLDHEVGKIIDALERTGQLQNTIIVYTADHGLALGQHGLMGKQNLYDHSIRVPFIISGPQIAQGRSLEELTCQLDIFPSICELAGADIPATAEGTSLVPWLAQNTAAQMSSVPVRKSTFAVYRDLHRAVKKDNWKLIHYYRSNKNTFEIHKTQLFNITEDPWEMHDLSCDHNPAAILQDLDAELASWQQQVGDHLLGVN